MVLGVCGGYDSIEACFGRLIRLHHVHLFAFAVLVDLAFVCIVVRAVVCPSTWSPAIFHPLPSATTLLASVNICVACASTFLIGVFAFASLLTFSRKSTCILLSSSAPVPFPADVAEDAPSLLNE